MGVISDLYVFQGIIKSFYYGLPPFPFEEDKNIVFMGKENIDYLIKDCLEEMSRYNGEINRFKNGRFERIGKVVYLKRNNQPEVFDDIYMKKLVDRKNDLYQKKKHLLELKNEAENKPVMLCGRKDDHFIGSEYIMVYTEGFFKDSFKKNRVKFSKKDKNYLKIGRKLYKYNDWRVLRLNEYEYFQKKESEKYTHYWLWAGCHMGGINKIIEILHSN